MSSDNVKEQRNYGHLLLCALKNREPLTFIDALINESALDLASIFVNNGHNHTLLFVALHESSPFEVIQYLVQKCPKLLENVDCYGYTPLHLAFAIEASVEVICLLLESYPKAAKMRNRDGHTPLHFAIRCRQEETVLRLLLETYPKASEMQDVRGRTALHWTCGHRVNQNTSLTRLMLTFGPQAARMQDDTGNTPLHYACAHSNLTREFVPDLVLAWPIACLLCSKASQYGSEQLPPHFPLDWALKNKMWTDELTTWEVLQSVTEKTIDAFYGWIDAVFHPSSGGSLRQDVVFAHVTTMLSPDIVATIRRNGMMTHEVIKKQMIRNVLLNEAIQAMLRDEKCAAVIHGFIQMNQAGRKDALKDNSESCVTRGVTTCASVSENVDCLFAHLRENSFLCVRQQQQPLVATSPNQAVHDLLEDNHTMVNKLGKEVTSSPSDYEQVSLETKQEFAQSCLPDKKKGTNDQASENDPIEAKRVPCGGTNRRHHQC